MVQSPSWAANWFAVSQEIPRFLRNPKVHYRTHKRPPPVSILVQPNPVHIPTFHLLEIHPNIIHPSTPRSPQWFLTLRFPHQDPIRPRSSLIRATCPAHLILLDFIPSTILGEEYRSFSFSLCNLLHSPFTSSLPECLPYRKFLKIKILLSFLSCCCCYEVQLLFFVKLSLTRYTTRLNPESEGTYYQQNVKNWRQEQATVHYCLCFFCFSLDFS